MPVILTTPAEVDLWLAADAPKALELPRPSSNGAVKIVASGQKEGPSRHISLVGPARVSDQVERGSGKAIKMPADVAKDPELDAARRRFALQRKKGGRSRPSRRAPSG